MSKRETQFRGCDHLVYALVTNDDNQTGEGHGYVTGTVKDLAVVKSISRTFNQDTAKVYGDNVAKIISQSAPSVTKSFEVFGIDPEVQAEITGQEVVTVGQGAAAKKAVVTKAGAVAPYIAVGYALYDTDDPANPCEYVWCFKAKAKTPDKSATTQDDGTDSTGQTLEIECVATEHAFTNGGRALDIASPDLGTGFTMSKWWNQVVTPDNIATVMATV